jgi:hypothetical protein
MSLNKHRYCFFPGHALCRLAGAGTDRCEKPGLVVAPELGFATPLLRQVNLLIPSVARPNMLSGWTRNVADAPSA